MLQTSLSPFNLQPSNKERHQLCKDILPRGQGRETQAIALSQPAPRISVGDSVRIFDAFYDQYHWHVVTEIITGAHHRIKVESRKL